MNEQISLLQTVTCESCRHWVKLPADPSNLGSVSGQCRHSPPQVALLPTGQGVVKISEYPQLPPNYAACGQHERRASPVVH